MFRKRRSLAFFLWVASVCVSSATQAQLDISTEERIWLMAHPVVRVAMNPNGRPFAFRNEQGQPDGYGWECTKLALGQAGLKCEVVWAEDPRLSLQAREADVVPVMNAEGGHFPGVNLTAPYAEIPNLLLMKRPPINIWKRRSISLKDLDGRTVAVPTAAYGKAVKDQSPLAAVVVMEPRGWEKYILELQQGRVDFMVFNAVSATDLVLKTGARNIVNAGVSDKPFQVSFGVRSDWQELAGILPKAYAGAGPDSAESILKRWDIYTVEQVGWRPTRLQMILGAAALMGLLAWNVVSRTLTLKRTVKERTAQLERAKQEILDKLDFEEALFNTIPNPVFFKDTEARLLGCNRAFEEAFGVSKASVLGKTMQELSWIPEATRESLHRDDLRLLEKPAREMDDLRLGPEGKEPRDYLHWKVSFPRRGGRVGGLLGVFVDITELKLAEAKIRGAEERLREITNSVPGAVWQYRKPHDGAPSYAFMSQGVEQLMGLEPGTVQKDFESVVGRLLEEDRPGVEESLNRSAESLATWSQDFRVHAPDGSLKWLHGEAVPQRTEDEGVLWNGYWVDVTDRKRLEQSLAASLKELQATQASLVEAQKMASLGQLVTGVAHELNTPLGVALTSASHLVSKVEELRVRISGGLLKRSELEKFMESQGECSQLILRTLERSAHLVQRFKQVATDQAAEPLRPFNLKDALEAAVSAVQSSRPLGSCAITIDCDGATTLMGHPGALRRGVQAVLENACDHGGERPVARVEARVLGSDQILIRIQDSGPGMDPDIRAHAFDPFFTTRRSTGHVGLGLPIAYNLVTFTLQGGIELDEAPEGGTLVSIRIPRFLQDPLMGKAQ